jgi:hypothetical protein
MRQQDPEKTAKYQENAHPFLISCQNCQNFGIKGSFLGECSAHLVDLVMRRVDCDASVPNCFAIANGMWLGNMIPLAPIRMVQVAVAK